MTSRQDSPDVILEDAAVTDDVLVEYVAVTGDVLAEAAPATDEEAGGEKPKEARVVMLGLPGPSKPIHDYPVCRSPVPRVKCHRHIDTVFVVIVLVVMLILVISESLSMKRFSS